MALEGGRTRHGSFSRRPWWLMLGINQRWSETEERLAGPVHKTTGCAMTPHSAQPDMGLGLIVPTGDSQRPYRHASGYVGPGRGDMAVPFLPHNGKKGKSPMGSNGALPWYNVPAREFPAREWLLTP
jgi:hypothetical protein